MTTNSSAGSKRRLSNGNNLFGLTMDCSETEPRSVPGKSSTRKSFGRGRLSTESKNSSFKSPTTVEKQARLAQMYSKIIQMATDNVCLICFK